MDLADQNEHGILPKDGPRNPKPVNGAAVRALEDAPVILTEADWLSGSMMRALAKRDESVRPCTSGHQRIDDAAGGIQPGFVWIFGALTNWGKSTWLVMLLDENLKRGKRVLLVGNEDSPAVYADRLMARRSGVNALRLRDGKLTDGERSRVGEVANAALPKPLHLDCRREAHRKAEWVARQVDRLIRDEGIDLVLFDYIQEFDLKRPVETERVKYREIGKILRSVVKGHNRSGVIFSQVTEMQTKKYPDKNSIRECRDLSNAAEAVLIGFTPKEGDHSGKKCILVDKVKNGPTGFAVELEWDENSAAFREQFGAGYAHGVPPPGRGKYDDLDPTRDEERYR